MSMTPARMSLNPELQNELVPGGKMGASFETKKGSEEQLLPITVDMSGTNLGTGKAVRKGRKLPTRRHETLNVTKFVDPKILKKEREAPSEADLSSDILLLQQENTQKNVIVTSASSLNTDMPVMARP